MCVCAVINTGQKHNLALLSKAEVGMVVSKFKYHNLVAVSSDTPMAGGKTGRAGGPTPRVLGCQPPPPPPRGLWPTISCQSYPPKEPMGAKGAQLSTNTRTTTLSA